MPKRVILVGHCGPDSAYLRIAITSASRDAQIFSVNDEPSLRAILKEGADLLLFNRQLDYGFPETLGVEVIRRLKGEFGGMRMMLVSNFADAQAAAVAAGASPGFGKGELGSEKVRELLQGALRDDAASPAAAQQQ